MHLNQLFYHSEGSSECCKSFTLQATGAAVELSTFSFRGTYVVNEEVTLGNNKVSVQLENFFAGFPQGPLETSPGTIGIIQKRFQGPRTRGF